MAVDDALLNGLQTFQDLVRAEQHETAAAIAQSKRKATDVTARWMGFDKNGMGLAEFEGKIYPCEVITTKCKKKFAQINLRRTKRGNYCDWQ